MKKKEKLITLILILIVVVILDFSAIIWIAKLPELIKYNGVKGVNLWISYIKKNIVPISSLFHDKDVRMFWLCLQTVVLTFIIILAFSLKNGEGRNVFGAPPSAGSGEFGTSRFQTESELNRTTKIWNTNSNLEKGGIVLGMKKIKTSFIKLTIYKMLKKNIPKEYDRVYLDVNDTHTLIIGTTRSGKSRRVIIPTIWELAKAGESMILTDPKSELYDKTKTYLESLGYEIVLLDFRDSSRGNRWNPMNIVVESIKDGKMDLASEAAWDIAHTIVNQNPGKDDPVWGNGAESVLASMILLTATEAENEDQKHLTSAYQTLYVLGTSPGEDKLPPITDYVNALPVDHPARAAFATAALAPFRMRASFFSTVSAYLKLFADPSISALTSKQDHLLDGVGRKKAAVFLVIPDEKTTKHVLASLYVDQAYQALVALASKSEGRRLPVRVNFLLDEFGNMPPIPQFDTKLTVAGGRGMRFHLVVQDLQQLESKYGKSCKTIRSNCHSWQYILTNDYETAKIISQMTGGYTIETRSSSSTQRNNDITSGNSKGLARRELVTPDELLRMPDDKSIVLRARQFPTLMDLPDLSKWEINDLKVFEDNEKHELEHVSIWVPKVKYKEKNSNGSKQVNEYTQSIKDEQQESSLDLI